MQKKHHLNVTIGSDFHHDDKIRTAIGFVNQNLELNDKEAISIINWILKNDESNIDSYKT